MGLKCKVVGVPPQMLGRGVPPPPRQVPKTAKPRPSVSRLEGVWFDPSHVSEGSGPLRASYTVKPCDSVKWGHPTVLCPHSPPLSLRTPPHWHRTLPPLYFCLNNIVLCTTEISKCGQIFDCCFLIYSAFVLVRGETHPGPKQHLFHMEHVLN